ncbi:MAG TPA: glycine cleavage system protein R [Candidatus Competibacteraceae bacterium]|nr:glycine cleavage system protein R [Candidatus Competibacteraceae bacterium]
MKNYLLVTALGENQPGFVSTLTQAVTEAGCSIVDSRMVALGSEFAAILMVHGNWNTLAKLEAQLKRLEQNQGLHLLAQRCEGRRGQRDLLPYAVEVIALDQPGIVHSLAEFFSSRAILIEELVCRSYSAPHTGTPMFSVNMVVGIPANLHIAMLREEFMDFCDHLNLDAVMEPVKG